MADWKKVMNQAIKQARQSTGGGGGGGGPAGTAGRFIGTAIVGGILALYGLSNSFYTVPPGSKAIQFSRISGVGKQVYGEGFHFKLPWFDRPIIYDCRSRVHQHTSPTGCKDLQIVDCTLRVLSRPMASMLPQIYEKLGLDFDDRVLPSIVSEVLKTNIARYSANELISQRADVSSHIFNDLKLRASEFHLVIDDCSITHLNFSRQYTQAIEEKQVAQQEAERAKFLVDKAIQDKQSTIIKAEGQAEAAKLIGQAIKLNPAYVELRQLETARDIAQTLEKSSNKLYLDSEPLLLNVLKPVHMEKKAQ